MIKKVDGKTGTREWVSIVAILIAIFSTDMTPTLLYKIGENASWMLPILWFVVILFPLLALLSLLKLYKNKGLIELIYYLTGKYLGFIIVLVLFIITFTALVLNSRSYADIVRGVFYPITPLKYIYVLIIAASYIIAKRGFETIGRVSFIVMMIFTLSILALIVLLNDKYDFYNIYPLLGPGINTITTKGITQLSIIGEIILISVFYQYSRSHKSYTIGSFLGLGIGTLILSVLLFVYVLVFNSSVLEVVPYPFHQVTKIAGVERFVTNLSSIYLYFWIQISIIRFALYLYLVSAIFSFMINLKEFENLLLPFAGLTIMLGLIPNNPYDVTMRLRSNVLLEQSWIIFLYLPIILWWIAYFKGDFKDEKNS